MSAEKHCYVYILASKRYGTTYIGVTSNLLRHITQHRNKEIEGFSKRYHTTNLVYYEPHATMAQAILREKQLKVWKRAWKIELIEKSNPNRPELI